MRVDSIFTFVNFLNYSFLINTLYFYNLCSLFLFLFFSPLKLHTRASYMHMLVVCLLTAFFIFMGADFLKVKGDILVEGFLVWLEEKGSN